MEKFLFLSVIALCGTLASSFNAQGVSRIIHGTMATAQSQYTVSLQKLSELSEDTRGHQCGGVLVTLQHAVTAASCNFNQINGAFQAINPAEYRVFSGQWNLTLDASTYNFRSITNITVHPQYYTSTPFVNDIAVIFLVQPFNSMSSTPVLLPINDVSFNELSSCIVSGWGAQDSTSSASVQLMMIYKRPALQSTCQTQYAGQITMRDTMMCANTAQTEYSSCNGDLGNPLVCGRYLNGILIFGKNCTVSTYPEVYTRIFSYNSWIRSLTGIADPIEPSGASSFQPGMAVLAVISIAQILFAKVSN